MSRLLIAVLLAAAGLAAAETPRQEARAIFAELIGINTTDSIGDNTRAARAVARRMLDAGYPAEDVQVVEPAPRKGNVVVRLRGSGAGKPILFLAHLDVVEARRADWSMDPFVLTEKNGYFYGRGTQDCKGDVSLLVETFVRLKREDFRPRRDLILALTSDEETGNWNGVDWLLKNHRDWIEAEFCINNDGGGGMLKAGKPLLYEIQAAEKSWASYHVVAKNAGGHSSLPVPDNAIYDVAEALERIRKVTFPVDLNPVTRGFFAGQAAVDPEHAADLRAIVANPQDTAAAGRLSKSPLYNALLRTTCIPTLIAGGHAENALPQSVDATINCRVLPQEPIEPVTRRLQDAVRGLPVTLVAPPSFRQKIVSNPPAEFIARVAEAIRGVWPGVPVIPAMDTGGSDGTWLRQEGIPTYGVSVLFNDVDDIRAHGRDERIRVESFEKGLEFEYRLVKSFGER